MRSFTLAFGLKPSSLASTVALLPAETLFKRTSGVFPISSVMSFAIFILISISPASISRACKQKSLQSGDRRPLKNP